MAEIDTIERTLWHATAPPAPEAPALAGDVDADVAVIGAGILGLSTALALAQAGVRVVVLEAAGIGEGASGRNGGLVVPALPRLGPAEVRARLAAAQAERLLALVAGSAETVFGLIRRHGIDCEAVQSGWLQPAHAATLAPAIAARAAAWQAAGGAARYLDAAETRRRMGSTRFHGALFDPTGGHLNPLAYARGLARAVLAAGGAVHARSPVVAVEREAAWRLRTAGGSVRARSVLQCTNAADPGLTGLAADAVRRSIVKLTVYQLATPVLPEAVRASVLAGNEAFSDTRNNLLACRYTAEGRMVTGGMAALQAGAPRRLPDRLARRLEQVFPALGTLRFDYVWRGAAALTGDFLPRIFRVAPDWHAPISCNGRGIAMCTALGATLAAFLGDGDEFALPIPVQPPSPIPLHALAHLVPQALLPLGDWQDRRAEARPLARG